jgi:hypothetical protein
MEARDRYDALAWCRELRRAVLGWLVERRLQPLLTLGPILWLIGLFDPGAKVLDSRCRIESGKEKTN